MSHDAPARSLRRAALARRKVEVRKRLRRWYGSEPSDAAVGIHAGVRRHCSCYLCSAKHRRPDAQEDSE